MNIREHFDKYLLSAFVIFFAAMAIWAAEHAKDANMANAMLDLNKLFVGALLGLITGRALASRVNDKPEGGKNELAQAVGVNSPSSSGGGENSRGLEVGS